MNDESLSFTPYPDGVLKPWSSPGHSKSACKQLDPSLSMQMQVRKAFNAPSSPGNGQRLVQHGKKRATSRLECFFMAKTR